MLSINVDIETRSGADLKKTGIGPYVESKHFDILWIALVLPDGTEVRYDLQYYRDQELFIQNHWPELTSALYLKKAWNAAFETTCLAQWARNNFLPDIDVTQWECTMVRAMTMGLPGSLDMCAQVLGVPMQKDKRGFAWIKMFSVPDKEGRFTPPSEKPQDYEDFGAYCLQDVRTEMSIAEAIAFNPWPESERKLWHLDQRINARGVAVDLPFVDACMKVYNENADKLMAEAVALTGLKNPNSVSQLKNWLQVELDEEVEEYNKTQAPYIPGMPGPVAGNYTVSSLDKKAILNVLKVTNSDTVKRMLHIRQQLGKASIKKYKAIQNVACADDRARHSHQFGGAGRTGRWAGRGIQVQNMKSAEMEGMAEAREVVMSGDTELVHMLYGEPAELLSALVRTAFVATPGKVLGMADLKQIEARVLAWLAGETWRLDAFRAGEDIYIASASKMFGVPAEKIGKDLRQRGKVSELALGYQGGVNALITMGALDKGLSEDELPGMVSGWRGANVKVVQLWYDVEAMAIKAMQAAKLEIRHHRGFSFRYYRGSLFLTLPSGRRLCYVNAKLGVNKFEKQCIQYWGVNDKKRWGLLDTYGGKLVENLVQAISRDILAIGMQRVEDAGFPIVLHVHDEIVAEVFPGTGAAQEMARLMSEPVAWAGGLPLDASAFESPFYRK